MLIEKVEVKDEVCKILTLGEELTLKDVSKQSRYDYSAEGLKVRNGDVSTQMSTVERVFTQCLLQQYLAVYREPHFTEDCECNSVPDFYVFNPKTNIGTVVEITMCKKDKLTERKKKQIDNLYEACKSHNLRFVPLFYENIYNIFKHFDCLEEAGMSKYSHTGLT